MPNILNRSQKKFCNLPPNKNVRLLAPAGSGKTYSLLWRCKYIVEKAKEKGEPEPFFLLVSFTRAAKLELEYRLKHDDDFAGIHATVRTLNAWGWEQVKSPGKELLTSVSQMRSAINHGLFRVVEKYPRISQSFEKTKGNTSKTWFDLIDLYKSLGFVHTMTKAEYKDHVKYLRELGLIKILEEGYKTIYNLLDVANEDGKTKNESIREFFSFWKDAVERLEAQNYFTLEDQKYWAMLYFKKQLAASKAPQGITRYTHIMIDEFQDINPLDLELIKCAVAYHSNKGKPAALTLIGDDDQAIFGWRGTSPKFILYPEVYFGAPFVTCVLDTNYRSPKGIVDLSSKLLSNNLEREPKEMRSVAKGRATIKVLHSKGQDTSIETTMKLVRKLVKDERYQQVALVGRRHVSLFPYQVLMSAEEMPYYVNADIDIYAGEAMKDYVALLQLKADIKNDKVGDPVEAILTICDKIGKRGLAKNDRRDLEVHMRRVRPTSVGDALKALKTYPDLIKNKSTGAIAATIEQLLRAKTVYQFLDLEEKSLRGLDKDYQKKEIDTHYKEPQFSRLKEISKKYKNDFEAFIRDIERARIAGERSREKSNDDSEKGYKDIVNTKLHLMTATRAKGHEFDAVIVLDADEDEWPSRQTEDIEEERRLFYVALSRAKKYLCFVRTNDKAASPFLKEAGAE